jgi:urea transport system permease protein
VGKFSTLVLLLALATTPPLSATAATAAAPANITASSAPAAAPAPANITAPAAAPAPANTAAALCLQLAAAVAADQPAQFAFLDKLAAAGSLDDSTRALLKLWSNGEIFHSAAPAPAAEPPTAPVSPPSTPARASTTPANPAPSSHPESSVFAVHGDPQPPAAAEPPPTAAAAVLLSPPDSTGTSAVLSLATGAPILDPAGAPVRAEPDSLDPFDTPAALRKKIQATLVLADLSAADPAARGIAARKLGAARRPENLDILDARLAIEPDPAVRKSLFESHALIRLANAANSDGQIVAAYELADSNCIGALDALNALAATPTAPAKVRANAARSAVSISAYADRVNFAGTLFRGTSLGSILLIAALGLAITFGLMGVINMAHGEMLTVGAYTAYIVENIFQDGIRLFGFDIPGMHAGGIGYEWYFVVAIPASFCTAALTGLIIERLVIRHLYRRALESLLATWGVSLILQQTFRLVFGANNVQVNSPSWLLGNFTLSDITFGYNRLFVIAFALIIVTSTWLLMTKTRLGLLIRSVTQDRDMAACMGVPTSRVNRLTFAFGSGLAGLAGAFLSQIGNVGPSLGQNFIVDNFMTVVVGGVGSIIGTVISALSIGISDQVLQQVLSSPVLGKIMTLLAVILFLQWKPGGLFPTKNRALDD